MEQWKETAKSLYATMGRNWSGIADKMMARFPGLSHFEVKEKIRTYIRGLPEYRKAVSEDFQKASMEYKADGTIISEKFITLRDGEEMTPAFILAAHGLKASEWEVVSYKNNFWNTQVRGGAKQISYQSKLTAKPRTRGLDLSEIDKHFAEMDRQHFAPPVIKPMIGTMMAELNVSDLHIGKLCWHGDTPEDFDYKIARDVYYRIIGEAAEQLRGKPIEYITFVWADDFFNSDNMEQTTTGGTVQDCDVRWQKMYNVGVEMLVRGIETLSLIAPVKTFYTPSNHDETTGYHALKYLEAWFRKDPNVEINSDAYPRKYQLYGNTLLGYCHGHTENAKGTHEKASRLASLMPIEVPELWGKSIFREMHVKHLHSEQMIQEINGVIVRRISSPTALDSWHTTSGFMGAVRKAQTFIYDKERGLLQTINIPVMGVAQEGGG